jgi:hypothetical protein
MSPIACVAALGLVLGLPALAQEPPAAAATTVAAADAPTVVAGLRSDYLQGGKIVVPITLRNDTAEAMAVPDLRERPWLVTFEMQLPNGNKQTRRTAVPESDAGRTVLLRPGAERSVLLEVPSGAKLAAGEYLLGLTIDLGRDAPGVVMPIPVRIGPARPVAGDVARAAAGPSAVDAVWLHEAKEGFDLYLHQADPKDPSRTLGQWFLTHLDAKATPRLTAARGQDAMNRAVVWFEGDRTVHALRLQGVQTRGAPDRITLPWPKAELVGQPAIDGSGRLHVPLWVPAPGGKRGELRVLTIGDRGRPAFRKLTALDRRPADLEVTVDAAGSVHLLVALEQAVDVYTVRATPPGEPDLPVPGRRVATAGPDRVVVGGTFGDLPEAEGRKGGLAVLVATRGESGLVSRWVGLRGGDLAELPALPWGPDDRLLALLPAGMDAPGVALRVGGGKPAFRSAVGTVPLPGGSGGDWSLWRTPDGAAAVRRVHAKGPVSITRL